MRCILFSVDYGMKARKNGRCQDVVLIHQTTVLWNVDAPSWDMSLFSWVKKAMLPPWHQQHRHQPRKTQVRIFTIYAKEIQVLVEIRFNLIFCCLVKPDKAQVVEFSFVASYSQVISGNTTKSVFIQHLRSFLAQLLNISEARITKVDIRSGSIIVTFTLLPSSDTSKASVNATLLRFEELVKTNNVNLTLPGSNQTLRVDSKSFKIIVTPATTPTPTSDDDDDDDDDDGLTTAEIVIIAVVCSVVVIVLIAAVVYYYTRVRPGKVSPHSSHMQLNEQLNNNENGKNGVDNAVVTGI
jgi:hypothetical protein